MTRKQRTWTDEQLRDAVARSTTYRAVHRALGLAKGPNHPVQLRIAELGLDASHFAVRKRKLLGTPEQLAQIVARSRSFADVLNELKLQQTTHNIYKLRRRLAVLGIRTHHFDRLVAGSHARRRWSDDDLRAAVAASYGYAATIRMLGLVPAGGNYVQVQKRIAELAIDISHFRGGGWNVTGQHTGPVARPLAELLVNGRAVSSHTLKLRLIREGLKPLRCELCSWAERRPSDGVVPLELDHINGDKLDNRLENLRVVCPNCHALQPTHRGLNKRSKRK